MLLSIISLNNIKVNAQSREDFTEFAKVTYSKLLNNDTTVINNIDFEKLSLFGSDINELYNSIFDERSQYNFKIKVVNLFNKMALNNNIYKSDTLTNYSEIGLDYNKHIISTVICEYKKEYKLYFIMEYIRKEKIIKLISIDCQIRE